MFPAAQHRATGTGSEWGQILGTPPTSGCLQALCGEVRPRDTIRVHQTLGSISMLCDADGVGVPEVE